jgi:hypothetical protein
MQLIKGGTSYEIHKRTEQRMEIWQPGFQDRTIRDEQDFLKKAEYIRMNPVAANLVATPEEWFHSSARVGWALDEMPETLASGAKAQDRARFNVGAKAPTP